MQRFYFIFETIIGLATLAVLNVTFFEQHSAFVDIHPHPYWLVILLVAGRYAAVEGLLTGCMTAGVYAKWGAMSGALHFGRFDLLHSDYTLPMAFVVIGFCAGLINQLVRDRKDEVNDGAEITLNSASGVFRQDLSNGSVQFDPDALSAAHLKIMAMQALTLTEFCRQVPAVLNMLIGVACASIYLLRNDRLQLQYRENDSGNGSILSDRLDLDSGIMAEVVRSKTTYCSATAGPEGIILAAPLLGGNSEVFGVINIEQIHPDYHIDENTIRLFKMLATWIAESLANMNRREEDHAVEDEPTGALPYRLFNKNLKYEISRARRNNLPLALLLIEVERFAEMSESERRSVLLVLDRIFENSLREVDIISKFNKESVFAIILPGQCRSDVEHIIERLLEDVKGYQLRPFEQRLEYLTLKTGYAIWDPQGGSFEKLLAEAEADLSTPNVSIVHELFEDIEYVMQTHKDEILEEDDQSTPDEAGRSENQRQSYG